MVTEKEAKKLAKEFINDLQTELGYELVYWFIGSVGDGKYVDGKSDIDIVIIPGKKNVPKTVDWGKACLLMLEKRSEEKYPRVFKKGRMTSIIDPVIMMNPEAVSKLREMYYDRKDTKVVS